MDLESTSASKIACKMNSAQKYACTRCRASKLRCLLETAAEHGKCRRCHDAGTDCIFPSIAPRQRRKRTDTRVAALEKQIARLQAATNGNGCAIRGHLSDGDYGLAVHEPALDEGHGREDSHLPTPVASHSEGIEEQSRREAGPEETIPDLVGSDLLPLHVATRLLAEFSSRILPEYPMLLLTGDDDFNSLRTSQATLLLAMITAAARASDPALFRSLHARLLEVLADLALVRGHRSLELVQAILVMEVWYDPPDDMERLNFYMWIQVAVTMVCQLGLWPWGKVSSLLRPQLDVLDERRMGEWRIAFAVYLSMSTAAVSLRRPLSMTWTDGMPEILERFNETSNHINDKCLVAWIKLQKIAEDIESSRTKVQTQADLAVSGNQGGISLSYVETLEGKLGQWRYAAEPVTNDSLRIHFFYCRIKLYELAVSVCQMQPLSLANLTARTGAQITSPGHAKDMTYIRIVMSLIQSCHSLLDSHLHQSISTYLTAPTVTTVRALYSMQVIYSLWKLVHSQQTSLSNFISEEVLGVRFYARQTKEFFDRAMGVEGFQVPRMAISALARVTNHVLAQPSEGHNLQQPQTSYRVHLNESPKDTPCTPSNDLESILTVDVRQSESGAHLSSTEQDPALLRSDNQATIYVASHPPFAQNYSLGGEGTDAMGLSEFEMMVMPEAGVDPSWLSAETEIYTGQHRSWVGP